MANAIEQKQVAQQCAQQAEYELQQAKAEAERQVAQAQGQAEAQKLLQQTLTPQLIQQQAIQKWDGRLPTVVDGNGVLPMIGNISGSHGKRVRLLILGGANELTGDKSSRDGVAGSTLRSLDPAPSS